MSLSTCIIIQAAIKLVSKRLAWEAVTKELSPMIAASQQYSSWPITQVENNDYSTINSIISYKYIIYSLASCNNYLYSCIISTREKE